MEKLTTEQVIKSRDNILKFNWKKDVFSNYKYYTLAALIYLVACLNATYQLFFSEKPLVQLIVLLLNPVVLIYLTLNVKRHYRATKINQLAEWEKDIGFLYLQNLERRKYSLKTIKKLKDVLEVNTETETQNFFLAKMIVVNGDKDEEVIDVVQIEELDMGEEPYVECVNLEQDIGISLKKGLIIMHLYLPKNYPIY